MTMAFRKTKKKREDPDRGLPAGRDLFLSHRSLDKKFVRRLATDIEKTPFENRNLYTWLDEAEIAPGQSIPVAVNDGLEKSRFVALIITPRYFDSPSGWTDAEWVSVINTDPLNRRGRILPILAEDTPYIPVLLRHLRMIDCRGAAYRKGLKEILSTLRNEPLPRPVPHRGTLITSTGKIDRAALVAERSIPQGDPDPVTEHLWCNLLPIERVPMWTYRGRIKTDLRLIDGARTRMPSKEELRAVIRSTQAELGENGAAMPAFRIFQDQILTFHDLESGDEALASVVDGRSVEIIKTADLLRNEEQRKIIISLLNMAISRHVYTLGLRTDQSRFQRFFFPAKNGEARTVTWKPTKMTATRTVAKPILRDGQVDRWIHQGAYLTVEYLASRFYLHIRPTRVVSKDGMTPEGGPDLSRIVNRWLGAERNLHVLYHVRFWTTLLRRKPGPVITVPAGDQTMEIASVPAAIQQSFGIENDQKNLMEALASAAPMIAREEDLLAGLMVSSSTEVNEVDDEAGLGDEQADS